MKELTINQTQEGDVTILEMKGPINIHTSMDAEEHLNAVIDHGDTLKLLIDLTETSFVSSSGLRSLLNCSKKMKQKNIPLAFCSLSETVREVFSLSGFDSIVNVQDTREGGLQNLNS